MHRINGGREIITGTVEQYKEALAAPLRVGESPVSRMMYVNVEFNSGLIQIIDLLMMGSI